MSNLVWIIIHDNNKFLLVQSSSSEIAGRTWGFPSNHFVSQKSVCDNLLNKIGIYPQDISPILEKEFGNIKLNVVLAANYTGNIQISDRSIRGVGWFSLEEIYNMTESLNPLLSRHIDDIAFHLRHATGNG